MSGFASALRRRWFPYVSLRPGAKMRLFCLHHAGGSASAYRSWEALLPAWVELWAVQLCGRETRFSEPWPTALAEVVEELEVAMRPWTDLPYAIFGHSMGARLGLELVRALERRSRPPALLLVSGSRAPNLPDPLGSTSRLDDAQLWRTVERWGGFPAELSAHPGLMALQLALLRADCALLEALPQSPDPRVQAPLAVYGGEQDLDVSGAQLEAWGAYTHRFLGVRLFPGDHFYLRQGAASLLGDLVHRLEVESNLFH